MTAAPSKVPISGAHEHNPPSQAQKHNLHVKIFSKHITVRCVSQSII